MTSDKPHRHPALHAALLALCAAAFLMPGACNKANVVSTTPGEAGGGGNSGAAGGESGSNGGNGGINLSVNSTNRPDAGKPLPTGGNCGDSTQQAGEQCDDGNRDNRDGCSAICQTEGNWLCPEPGQPCKYVGDCGSGVLTTNKTCDDGNTKSGDGCSGDCTTIEPGFICRVPGKACTTRCGDGQKKGFETCDDGNTDGGDGCSANCKIEPGFDCTGSPSTCTKTVCGNKVVEEGETCDDGNLLPYDGCASNCQKEPVCGSASSAVGECKSTCGDGILWPGMEDCDDGNGADGDGCSKDCKVEGGWTCKSFFDDPPPKLEIPIISRDFEWYTNSNPPTGHPDFGVYCCDDSLQKGKGVLKSTLNPKDHRPDWGYAQETPPEATAKQIGFTGKTWFDMWYHDDAKYNKTFYQSLTLVQSPTAKTTYSMDSDNDQPFLDMCGFFPLDDLSKPKVDQNTGKPITYTETRNNVTLTCKAYEGLGFGNSWANHNYSFTTELRYWFQYQGNEKLKFTGDDDVWVFINGTMVIEMPGIHNRSVGTVVLDAANGKAQVGYGETPTYTTLDLGLKKGSVYEAAVFQAERWCCGSNYMLTLANFIGGRIQCEPTCGDGETVADEECDCGNDPDKVPAGCPGPNSDSTYGGCTKQCKWGAFCGDGVVQEKEECDKGKDNGSESSKCSIACQSPRSCGDGKADTDLGEECDLGTNNGLKLDSDRQPVADQFGSDGRIYCNSNCSIPPQIYY
jgi:fibro-slime domain-containing protein